MDSLVAYLAALNVVFQNVAILGGVSPCELSRALDDYGNNEAWGSHHNIVVVLMECCQAKRCMYASREGRFLSLCQHFRVAF